MRIVCRSCVVALVTSAIFWTLASGKSTADDLQATLDDTAVDGRWIYNDWPAAQARAKRENKPILAMFR